MDDELPPGVDPGPPGVSTSRREPSPPGWQRPRPAPEFEEPPAPEFAEPPGFERGYYPGPTGYDYGPYSYGAPGA
jgi:hypothetical protein